MQDLTKKKIAAAGKVAIGVVRMFSGIATGTGHGLVGTYLKNRHMQAQAARLGKMSFDAGQKCASEGLKEWKALQR